MRRLADGQGQRLRSRMDYDRHCGQDRRPLLPIQASFANAAQFFNSLLGADLSAMWETFHGDNRKRTATNAVAPIIASTVVPSPRSGLGLRSSCIISPNAPNVQTSSTRERSSGASATASGAKLPESRVSRVGAQILMGLANRCNQSVESRLRRNNRTSSILLHRPQRY